MNDKERQAIEKLNNVKKMDLISIIRTFKRDGIENFVVTKKETVETVLNLVEKKDKRISNLEFTLMDMVLQFADENKDSINTRGLSALEIAFNELNFDNPMSIKEVHKRYKELAQKYYQ